MKKFLLSLVSLLMLTLFAQAGEVKINYTGTTTTNMTGGNDAALFGLSADDWSIVGDKGANSNFPGLNKAGDLRLYWSADGGNTVTVTVLKEGSVINKIKSISFNGDSYSNVTISVGGTPVEAVGGEYAINATSFVIGNGNTTNVQVRISSILLEVEGLGGEVVHIANTAETAYTVAEAMALIDAGQALDETVFVKGIVSQVDKFNDSYNSIQYWISDDGTTTNQFECYSGKGIGGANFTSVDDVKVGATVVVKGLLTKYNDVYEFKQNNELVSYKAPAPLGDDFEAMAESNAIGIRTYAKDIKGEEVATMQEIAGWNIVANGDARAAGIFAYGSAAFLGGEGYVAPAAPFFEGATKALGMCAVWSASLQYTKEIDLKAGNYMLQVPVYNAGGATAIANNLIGVDGTYSATKTFAVGGWTVENVEFTVAEDKTVTLSLGYAAANSGSAAMPHLFLESAIIYSGDEAIAAAKAAAETRAAELALAKAKADALAKLDAYVIGTGLFQYSQSAVDAAKAAVEAATTVEEVAAVPAPAVTAPDAEKFYSFQLKEGGNYLAADGGIKLAEKAMGFKFVAAEGGYALTADGTNYVACTGTGNNTWSMGLTEAPYTWVVTCLADGEYTLSKVGKPAECIGVDNTTAGSACYANKAADAKGTWAIAEYVAPVLYNVTVAEGIENGTVVASPVQAEEGETVTLTITPAEGYELDVLTVKAGENDVEVSENTFAMPAADVTVSATFKEQTEPTPEPEVFAYQKYIIKNVESGMFWGAGNDWGTQASLVPHPEYVKLDPNGDGTYKLESQVNNGGTNYYFNGSYMDNDQPVALTITKLENGNYTIANGTNYYGWDGTSTVLGQNLAADSKNAEWTIQSLDDAKAALANATVEAPMDATLLIEDHDFGRNNRYVNRWTLEASNQNLSGGNNKNNCAESYHATFTLSQVLQGAPKGVYAMTAQGFYRQDGSDNDNLPYFYANDEKGTFPLLTGPENSMAAASESFTAGKYTIDPIFVKVEEGGTLTIGAKLETNTALWCIWDNFVLTYYGDCDLAEAKFAGLVAQVNALKAEAEALVANTGNVSETTVAALQAAIASTESIEATEEAYKAVINGLTAAVNQGKLDVDNKAAIDAMYALIESTNFYTAEAKTTYTAEADDYKAAWEAGTLTTKVDNPATIHNWRAANTADDFLLSAWTINDVQAKEFDTALYINTWSIEGESDGTEFKVPFFEYWTGDDNSLGAAKLTATMNDLPAGLYEVSAWVRVRAKNGFTAPATGITMDVNGGEATDVAAGTQVENTQFFLANFKAVGVVGEDGVLKANFNVAADNNISWLSFKNVTFAPKDETEYAYEQALASIEDGKGYRVFTEVGENKFYLTTTGTLVADTQKAATFTFKAVTINNGAYPTGWNLGCKFTNPSLTGGSTGDVVQNGKINVSGNNDRDNWERQVFFLKDGKYAVRATNATGSNWGANTYWTVTNTEAELPNADYSLDMNYVWQIEANVDNRPEAFAKTRNWIAGLQKVYGLATEGSQFISNAKESKEGSYEALVDGDYASFFHSSWSTGADADHYLQIELSEPVEDFYFYMKKRQQNNNNRPTDIVITASNDGETFADVTEITEGLPTGATPLDYTSDKISMTGANKTIRFTVTHTNNEAKEGNGHVFFTASEFYILPSNELTDAAIPYSKCADYTDLTDEDVDVINAIDAQLALLVAKKNLEEDYAALDALVAKIEAYVNATETYTETTEGIAANTTEALNTLKNAAYETADEITEAKAKAIEIGKEFFAGIKAVKPIEVTEFYIVNPTPVAKGNNDGWEGTGAGDASNGVAEYWNQSGADFHQTVTLPAGNYRLTVVALQRVNQTGVVYAGENKTTIAQVASSVANNRAQAANWFAAGNGKNEVYFTMAEAGDIVIGLTADATTADYWTVWQSFGLEKVGELYTVSVAETENGTVTADKLVGIEGTKVTLTTTPAEGYELDALSVKAGETDVEVTKNTFVMPAGNVTVSASFKLIPVAADITLASVTYGGEAVTFDENKAATIEGAYDAEKELVVVATAAEDVTVDVAYPTEVGETQIVITVADKDTENFPDNKATYTITFSVATGINALAAEDGKAVIYDMNGRRVSRNAKGVLIINGKKQLVK